MRQIVIIVSMLALCACSDQKAEPVEGIDSEQFELIYLELVDSAQAVQAKPDSLLSPVAERILARHQVTAEQFRATVKEYNKDTQRWKKFYDNVLRRIDERTKRVPSP